MAKPSAPTAERAAPSHAARFLPLLRPPSDQHSSHALLKCRPRVLPDRARSPCRPRPQPTLPTWKPLARADVLKLSTTRLNSTTVNTT